MIIRGIKKIKTKRFGAILVIILALFLIPNVGLAVTQQDLNTKNQELQNAKNALNNTQNQRKTLQGEVANYDSQIGSLQSQINQTQSEIDLLNSKINEVSNNIKISEEKLNTARSQLSEIIRVAYEDGQQSDIEVIAKSNNFSDFVNRSEYIEAIQVKVKGIADDVVFLMDQLNLQKKNLETDKQKTEDLKNQQLAQKQQVGVQRNAKDMLLAKTKGDEAAYQALVKKIQSDYQRIQNQLWAGSGNYVSLGHVYAGDIIGYIGNSGYSTGCHLHFEIRNSSQQSENPANYMGNGYFINPVPGVWVSAPYGYSAAYFPGVFHTGIDYADGCAGTPIKATAEGDIIARVTGRPNTYDWSVEYGNYVKIKHTNGMYSLYGHMR